MFKAMDYNYCLFVFFYKLKFPAKLYIGTSNDNNWPFLKHFSLNV